MEHTNKQGGGEPTSRELSVLKGGPTKLSFERRSNHQPGKAEPLVGWEEGRNPRPQTHLEPVLGWSLIQQLLQLLLQLQQGVQDHLLSQLSPSGWSLIQLLLSTTTRSPRSSSQPALSIRLVAHPAVVVNYNNCLLYTSPSPRDATLSRMPSSA